MPRMPQALCFFSAALCFGGLGPARGEQVVDEALLGKLRAEAARAHPAALAARGRAEAAGLDFHAARLWDDPVLGVSFMGASRMMRRDDGDITIGLSQTLPKPGLFEAERHKAAALARAADESVGAARLRVGSMAALAAIELALADGSLAVREEQTRWLREMVENAGRLAADPSAGALAALRLETELAGEEQALEAAGIEREGYARRLNLILGRREDGAWPRLRLPAGPPPVPVAVAEIARIGHANPEVRALKENVAAAGADARIADSRRRPEVTVGVSAGVHSGSGDVRGATVGVQLSLPWFNDNPNRAAAEAARTRAAAAVRDVQTREREIAVEVAAAAAQAAAAAVQARALSGEIREKAAAALEAAEAAWVSSRAPLADLLDAARTLRAIRLEQRRVIAVQLSAQETLHSLVPSR